MALTVRPSSAAASANTSSRVRAVLPACHCETGRLGVVRSAVNESPMTNEVPPPDGPVENCSDTPVPARTTVPEPGMVAGLVNVPPPSVETVKAAAPSSPAVVMLTTSEAMTCEAPVRARVPEPRPEGLATDETPWAPSSSLPSHFVRSWSGNNWSSVKDMDYPEMMSTERADTASANEKGPCELATLIETVAVLVD